MIAPAIRWRSTSPTISPANGASDQIGSERKRSNRPFAEIGRQAHAGIDRVERDGLHQDAGQEELQIGAGRAGERAAEDEGEEQREHDRRHHQIEQLLRHVLELQHRAPAEDERVGEAPRAPEAAATVDARSGARLPVPVSLMPLSPTVVRRPAAVSVSAKKTSSRLGEPIEKSASSIPAATSAASASLRRLRRSGHDRQLRAFRAPLHGAAETRLQQLRGLVELRRDRRA